MGIGLNAALNNFSYDMSGNKLGNHISVNLLGKAIMQSAIQAGGVLSMLPPPSAPNEIGGLLDTRA